MCEQEEKFPFNMEYGGDGRRACLNKESDDLGPGTVDFRAYFERMFGVKERKESQEEGMCSDPNEDEEVQNETAEI